MVEARPWHRAASLRLGSRDLEAGQGLQRGVLASCLLVDKIFLRCLARLRAEEARARISLISGFPAHTETSYTVGLQLMSQKSPPGKLQDQLPLSSQSDLDWAILGGCTALATSLMALCLSCLICVMGMLKCLPHRVDGGVTESMLGPVLALGRCSLLVTPTV